MTKKKKYATLYNIKKGGRVKKIREYLMSLGFIAMLVFGIMVWGLLGDPSGYSDAGRMATQAWCWITVIALMLIGVLAEKQEMT